jgi:hypothetical protein
MRIQDANRMQIHAYLEHGFKHRYLKIYVYNYRCFNLLKWMRLLQEQIKITLCIKSLLKACRIKIPILC